MIGESESARIVARGGAVVAHATPLGADAEFVEFVLDAIRREIDDGGLQNGHPVTFVFYRFFGVISMAAPFGPKVDIIAGKPQAGAVYVSSERFRTVQRATEGGATPAAHEAVIGQKGLQDTTRVTFEPNSRQITIRCRELGSAPSMMRLAAGTFDWSAEKLEDVIEDFHHSRLDAGPTVLWTYDGTLRRDGVSVYRNALYLYLKFEIGLDGDTGFRVATNDDSVIVRKHRTQIASLAACGIRHGRGPASETKRLHRLIGLKKDLAAKDRAPRMRLSCLACGADPDLDGSTTDVEAAFHLRHHHFCEGSTAL